MAHLLMIESWVGGTGRLFPSAITQLGHQFTFVTRNKKHYLDAATHQIHPLLEQAKHILTAETNNISLLIPFLEEQHEILKFDGVFTICDYYIETVAQVAHALHLPQAYSSNVAQERRKHLVREALEQAGLPNPLFRVTTSWEDTQKAARDIGYPLVLKPSDLASSAFVRLVNNEQELYQAFSALEQFPENFREQVREPLWLLEEYMTGEEISVEACTFKGETTILGITDKSVTGSPYFIEDGHMFPARLAPAQIKAIEDMTLKALKAVGHDHGISHTELKLTADGPCIIEINPRPAGNYIPELIEYVTGINFLSAQIELALGKCPDLNPKATSVKSAAIKFLTPPKSGLVRALEGIEQLEHDQHLKRWSFNSLAGCHIPSPIDNACYLGHVVAIDPEGQEARRYAENALSKLQLVFSESTL